MMSNHFLYKENCILLAMIHQIAMPAMCNKCGQVFDMSYDLNKGIEEEIEDELENHFVLMNKKGVFCWECRSV